MVIQVVHTLPSSHRAQFKAELHTTQPVPFVVLQVYPVKQHPGDPIGFINLFALQTAHVEAVSHLVQCRVDGHATQ